MIVKVHTATLVGLEAEAVRVEVDIEKGIGSKLVGLAGDPVKESWERITTALKNSGRRMTLRKVTVSLVRADLPKRGSCFDLPIALGMLGAMEQVQTERFGDTMFFGELSLDGSVLGVRGILSLVLAAFDVEGAEIRRVVVPAENAAEAAVVGDLEVIGVSSLLETIEWLNGERTIEPARCALPPEEPASSAKEDMADVKGLELPRRALEVAAAGGHNILMIGPPGVGKSMLAGVLPSILPPLTPEEALETTRLHAALGEFRGPRVMQKRPFRQPHHTSSEVSLIGGGQQAKPGEIVLAHNGVLFLDELPEFGKRTLEALRQPLEDREVHVARANYRASYPADVMVVGAMNPCPCGYCNDPHRSCSCTPQQVRHYRQQLSGPLMDRIDLQIEMVPEPSSVLQGAATGETSAEVRERVVRAREVQLRRFAGTGIRTNARMNAAQVAQFCRLDASAEELLRRASDELALTARGHNRILKVARTIADLAGHDEIGLLDVAEAIGYRCLDRERPRYN